VSVRGTSLRSDLVDSDGVCSVPDDLGDIGPIVIGRVVASEEPHSRSDIFCIGHLLIKKKIPLRLSERILAEH